MLERYGVELIGAQLDVDPQGRGPRALQARRCSKIGLDAADVAATRARSRRRARIVAETGFPAIIRPRFTLGGTGGGIACDDGGVRRDRAVRRSTQSPDARGAWSRRASLGWKEFELEVMRDRADNVVIICSIENFDPMGVHTGDSITVAPAQTLTDKEYQGMRDAAIAIIREIGVETGGSNIQFARRTPRTARMVVIEMNPRVSRSLGARVEGDRLPDREDRREARRRLHARRDPERHHARDAGQLRADDRLRRHEDPALRVREVPAAPTTRSTTQMKSVGEVMAIGRTFKEALPEGAALARDRPRGLRAARRCRDGDGGARRSGGRSTCRAPSRLWAIAEALPARRVASRRSTGAPTIDPWFLRNIEEIVDAGSAICAAAPVGERAAWLRPAKQRGFSDRRLARLWDDQRGRRCARCARSDGVRPVYKRVDTCAAEFEAHTPYLYSTYEDEGEARADRRAARS